MEDPENLGSGMAGAGDSLVKQYPPATHQFLEVPLSDVMVFRRDSTSFLAGALSPGMRAVAIPVTAASSAAGFILPGNFGDIILTHDVRKDYQAPSQEEEVTPLIAGSIVRYTSETIVRNVHVVAVDQSFNDLEGEATIVKTVTVEVTPNSPLIKWLFPALTPR